MAQFVADRHDIYGSDVNLTARIATLAGPGEIVISSELRDQLTDGLDAELEDLGDCHLKHVAEPVRAYRVGQCRSRARACRTAKLTLLCARPSRSSRSKHAAMNPSISRWAN